MLQLEEVRFLQILSRDDRINVWHIGMVMAMLISRDGTGQEVIKISRRIVMQLSCIRSISTYHKYLSQLVEYGYVRYRPSYHPGIKSEIELRL